MLPLFDDEEYRNPIGFSLTHDDPEFDESYEETILYEDDETPQREASILWVLLLRLVIFLGFFIPILWLIAGDSTLNPLKMSTLAVYAFLCTSAAGYFVDSILNHPLISRLVSIKIKH